MYEAILTPRTTPVVTPEALAAFGHFDCPQSSPVSEDYKLLQTFIEAATDEVESLAATACLNEQVILTFDFFPNQQDPRNMFNYELSYAFNMTPWWWYGFVTKDSIELVRRPVIVPTDETNALVVQYRDQNGIVQTFDPANYTVAFDKITLNSNASWPMTDRHQDCVQISYWTGYDATDPSKVPARLKLAVMYLANHFWQIRDIISVEPTSEVGMTLTQMLSSFRSARIPH